MPDSPKRKLAAIMFTEMVGYTALMQDGEAKVRELVPLHRELMKPLVEKHFIFIESGAFARLVVE